MRVAGRLLYPVFLAMMSWQSSAQLVPEGVHHIDQGPVAMCGLVGRDVRDFVSHLRASPSFQAHPIESSRFELFASTHDMDQIVVTRPSEPAYPAVTCRHIYQEGGAWLSSRATRCEASRDACDRLYVEFQNLDAEMRRAVQERAGAASESPLSKP